ncbi:DMT family transporter [Pengzhenrongella frigida]|uniref:DMT family transporter n=2 Tax=Pengzhenrongella frigida TaxID=1259133 RepID=A0A4Q5MX24_9MICO|nr:DMT family transporter [Cellulomonas sp. HLT2-17]
MRPRDFALVVVGAVLWGSGGIAGTFLAAGSDLSMIAVASYRLLVGGGVLAAGLLVAGRVRRTPWRPTVGRSRPVVIRILATGALAATYQATYFVAVSLASVSAATFVALGAAPVVVAVATAARARRRPATHVVVAMGLALAGLALLLGVPATGGPRFGLGLGLALVSAIAFAVMTLLNSRPLPGLEPLTLTAVSFSLGGAVLLPFAAVVGAGLVAPSGADGWLLIGFLGAVPTAAAYGAYFAGLRRVPATTAAVLALLEPLTAAVGAALLLGERLGPAGVAGAALLAAAIVALRPRGERVI